MPLDPFSPVPELAKGERGIEGQGLISRYQDYSRPALVPGLPVANCTLTILPPIFIIRCCSENQLSLSPNPGLARNTSRNFKHPHDA